MAIDTPWQVPNTGSQQHCSTTMLQCYIWCSIWRIMATGPVQPSETGWGSFLQLSGYWK
jgi:hypothetical protein